MDRPLSPRFDLEPQSYGPVIAGLLDAEHLPPLGPGVPNRSAAASLHNLQPAALFSRDVPVKDPSMAACCLAGLWLWHDCLDESHVVSQSIETTHGSHWHAIMHRREGDYGNAKYWYRRVGTPSFFDALGQWAEKIIASHAPSQRFPRPLTASGAFDPYRFVDWCQKVDNTGSDEEQLCRLIARAEWVALFDECFNEARR